MRRLFLLAVSLILCSVSFAQNAKMTHRWFYLQTNLLVDANAKSAQELLRRAEIAGYNGVVITDSKFDVLGQMPPRYFENARAVKQTARELGIGVFPVVCGAGYEGGVLSQNPQLAEAFPVQGKFVAQGGALEAVSDVSLQNGDFERSQNNKFGGWNFQDGPGQSTFADSLEKHGGASSIRMEQFARGNEAGNARVQQLVSVAPHSWLHLSVWIKTRDFETPDDARALVLGANGQPLSWVRWPLARTKDWTRYDATFSSGDNAQIRVYFGVWEGRGGQIWWDDARLENAGLCNLVRRGGAPFQVSNAQGTVCEEGRDFVSVRDEKTGHAPWTGNFDDWHEPPVVRLTPNSRIKNGEAVRVSFYAVQKVEEGSVAPCLSEPQTLELMRDATRRVVALWEPQGLFLGFDEIRQLGSCDACGRSGKTAAQILAEAAQKCVAFAREDNPERELWIWSDMFDPNHNARQILHLEQFSGRFVEWFKPKRRNHELEFRTAR